MCFLDVHQKTKKFLAHKHHFAAGNITPHCTGRVIPQHLKRDDGTIKAAGSSLRYLYCLLLAVMYDTGALWLTSSQQFKPSRASPYL